MYRYGWRGDLPAETRFFDQPIQLRFETRPVPRDDTPPPPELDEIELARLILGKWSTLHDECERHYREYNAEFPELLGKVSEPHIWICREWLGEEPPGKWAFVSGISDAPDWGIHIEFTGLEFKEIWSGD